MSQELTVLNDVLIFVQPLDQEQRQRALSVLSNIRSLDDEQYARVLRVVEMYFGEAVEPNVPSRVKDVSLAAARKRILKLRATGQSFAQVASKLNSEGFSRADGKPFDKNSVYNLIRPSSLTEVKPEVVEAAASPDREAVSEKIVEMLRDGPKPPRDLAKALGVTPNKQEFRIAMRTLQDSGKIVGTGLTATREYRLT